MILKAPALNLEAKQTLCFFMFLTQVIQLIHWDRQIQETLLNVGI